MFSDLNQKILRKSNLKPLFWIFCGVSILTYNPFCSMVSSKSEIFPAARAVNKKAQFQIILSYHEITCVKLKYICIY